MSLADREYMYEKRDNRRGNLFSVLRKIFIWVGAVSLVVEMWISPEWAGQVIGYILELCLLGWVLYKIKVVETFGFKDVAQLGLLFYGFFEAGLFIYTIFLQLQGV